MKNNNGFGKFEVLTLIVVLLVLFVFLMSSILDFGGSMSDKFSRMESDAIQFNKTVYSNTDSFKNENIVYLEEIEDLKLMDKFKSPFGSETCSFSESKVVSDEMNRFVTLRCDDYIINNVNSADLSNVSIYKVGKWSEDVIEGKDVEKKELYNCIEDGRELFDNYLEDSYLLYSLNKMYSMDIYDISNLSTDVCSLVKKTFYRTLELQDRSK